MRLPRMTTRRWMIAVAIVAVAIEAEMMRRRGVAYGERTFKHAKQELVCRMLADKSEGAVARSKSIGEAMMEETSRMVVRAKYYRQRAALYEGLKKKYRHAARYPWLPIDPDPPPPRL